jgi:hypothetical protein
VVELVGQLHVGDLPARRRRRDGHPRRTDQLVEVLLYHRVLEQLLKSHYLEGRPSAV